MTPEEFLYYGNSIKKFHTKSIWIKKNVKKDWKFKKSDAMPIGAWVKKQCMKARNFKNVS